MNRHRLWVVTLLLCLALFAIGVLIVQQDIGRFRADERELLRQSCYHRAIVFEEFVEYSIVRDQRETLDALARFLLVGDGLYVDVVFDGASIFHGHDEGFDIEALHLAPDEELPLRTAVDDIAQGDVEVRIPLIFDGIPDEAFGMIRIGFSGDYARGQVRSHGWKVAGLAAGSWAAVVLAGSILIWQLNGRQSSEGEGSPVLRHGSLEIDTEACCARLAGVPLDLTPKLYDLLLAFARSPGAILSDQDLLEAVWADSTYAASPDVKQHIYLLRRRLKAAHPDPKAVIVNVKGFGYRLDPPANEDGLSEA